MHTDRSFVLGRRTILPRQSRFRSYGYKIVTKAQRFKNICLPNEISKISLTCWGFTQIENRRFVWTKIKLTALFYSGDYSAVSNFRSRVQIIETRGINAHVIVNLRDQHPNYRSSSTGRFHSTRREFFTSRHVHTHTRQ